MWQFVGRGGTARAPWLEVRGAPPRSALENGSWPWDLPVKSVSRLLEFSRPLLMVGPFIADTGPVFSYCMTEKGKPGHAAVGAAMKGSRATGLLGRGTGVADLAISDQGKCLLIVLAISGKRDSTFSLSKPTPRDLRQDSTVSHPNGNGPSKP